MQKRLNLDKIFRLMAANPDFAAAVSRILFVGRSPSIELVSAKLTHGS
jgi:hypothetical protein